MLSPWLFLPYTGSLCIFIHYHGYYNYYPHIQGSKTYKTLDWQKPSKTVHKILQIQCVCMSFLDAGSLALIRFPKRFGPLLKEDNYWLILLTAPKSLLPAQLFPQSLKLLPSTTYQKPPTKCSRQRSNLSCTKSLVNSHSKLPTSAQILQFSSSNTNHLVIQATSINLNFSSSLIPFSSNQVLTPEPNYFPNTLTVFHPEYYYPKILLQITTTGFQLS